MEVGSREPVGACASRGQYLVNSVLRGRSIEHTDRLLYPTDIDGVAFLGAVPVLMYMLSR